MRVAAAVFLMVVFFTASCERAPRGTQASPVSRPEPAPHEFLERVLESLAQANRGIKMGQMTPAILQSATMADLMTANQNARIQLRIAAKQLEPLGATTDSTRHAAVEYMLSGYGLMLRSLEIQMAGYQKVDSAGSAEDLRGLSKGISDARVAYQQGGAILVQAVTLAFGSVIVPDPSDPEAHVALNMTAGEKTQLTAAADSLFAGALSRDVTDSDTGALTAARVVREMLAKPWRLAK